MDLEDEHDGCEPEPDECNGADGHSEDDCGYRLNFHVAGAYNDPVKVEAARAHYRERHGNRPAWTLPSKPGFVAVEELDDARERRRELPAKHRRPSEIT